VKRSEINEWIDGAVGFFETMCFPLPPFAHFSLSDWRDAQDHVREIVDCQLGWDITDFGAGDFRSVGLLLFTLRNGRMGNSDYPKSYAEKAMLVLEDQVTPMHFHWTKMEDIINRGGGNLVLDLYGSTPEERLDASRPVSVSLDGICKTVRPGESVVLRPGESITLFPRMYHTFRGECGRVIVGEVSTVNDDVSDNRFFKPVPRFSQIEEDTPPKYLLCNEYSQFLKCKAVMEGFDP
jgi:hypothetical protein